MVYDGRLLSGVTVLMAVVEAGSMARAADALGLTPSGVGRAIARLEARLGTRLLERTTRTLALTEEGRRFHEQVGPMLDGIEEAAQAASGAAQAVRGRLRVNMDPFFSRMVLARRLAGFLDDHPDLRVELVMRERVGDLIADGFDLALRFGEPTTGSFVARKLAQTRVLTVAAPSYLAAHGCPTHPGNLAHHRCIDFYDPASARPFEWEFRRAGELLPVAIAAPLMVSDTGTMLEACLSGAGIAQILQLGHAAVLASGQLVELFADWSGETFPLYAVAPSRHHRAAKVRVFIEFCLQALAAETGDEEAFFF